ncbi:MAG TPA: right-handed parallel beta-helix repeat-containing protein [Pyrinomonadaceae bacterium]|jgi:parallel beta-helix repeat protein|nr:right-handed parallel beta-helix repeat-containing protein [Pyrinomonadaceae bacterium]
MSKSRFTINILTTISMIFVFAVMAQAQATRTWVSGVGDDVNPCSRTAPCKTWAGAISKTADKGEINALDPGGYGTLTITKSITVDGGGTMASTLSALAPSGFTINDASTAAPRTINVILRRLSINGAASGTTGIRMLSGKSLHVEDCVIENLTTHGIELNNNLAGHQLFVTRTSISNVGVSVAGGSAIRITGAAPTPHTVVIDTTDMFKGRNGVFTDVSSRVTIRNSTISSNTDAGVAAVSSSDVNVKNCVITHNTDGVTTQGTATMRLADNIISQNSTNVRVTAGTIATYGTNQIRGNTGGGDLVGVLTSLAPQQ